MHTNAGTATRLKFQRMNSSEFPAQGIYRHKYGGIYEVTGNCRHSTDGSPLVCYRHVWPFESSDWARPLEEWSSRFSFIGAAGLAEAQSAETREAAQARITASRSLRSTR